MATDTAQDQQNQQGQSTLDQQRQQGQQGQQGQLSQQGQTPEQSYVDQQFISQMIAGFDPHDLETSRELSQSYWRMAQETIDTARRVSEAQMLRSYKQQIVREVATATVPAVLQSVLQTIRQHPEWLKTS